MREKSPFTSTATKPAEAKEWHTLQDLQKIERSLAARKE